MAGAGKGSKSGDVKESTDSSTTIEEDEKGNKNFQTWIEWQKSHHDFSITVIETTGWLFEILKFRSMSFHESILIYS